ncbi:MAG TPA: peptide chain release factor N(5)-glutamine methyltransferase, partial [Phycisphaerae bacterium]|nr:peptide chain release factor N(5)-glutamine methyltransferase [Phycisphaerae bacterium]
MADTGEQPTVWTIGRLLDWTAKWFREKQVEGGRLAAELLLARALNCRKIDLYTRYDSEPSEDQRRAFRELVRQAGDHTPIAYLLGSREFFSLEFQVGPAVLIPRPETEALAQRMIDLCRSTRERRWRILDLGTGSGCVAVAVAKYAPNAVLVASDISEEALAVARANIEHHGLSDRIRTVVADGFALPAECIPEGGFDAVVSNPPYISEAVYANLPPNIRDHEPRVALVPPCSDGLEMYRRFASEAPAVLGPGGRLLAEIGHDQLAAVQE